MHYEDRKKAGVAQKVLVSMSMCESFTTIFKAKDAHETLLIWSRLIAKDYQVRNLHLTVKGGEHFGTERMRDGRVHDQPGAHGWAALVASGAALVAG